MGIYLGNTGIVKAYLGNTEIQKLYHGSILCYSSAPVYPTCLNTNTVGWYVADELSTITKDDYNLVSQWNDKLGGGVNLTSTGTGRPTWSATGIVFNGTSNYIAKPYIYMYQPVFIYLVFKSVSWVNYRCIIDGRNDVYFYQAGGSTSYYVWGGDYMGPNWYGDGYYVIARIQYHGANSKIIFGGYAVTGNISNNPSAITIGSFYPGGDNGNSNIVVKELIVRTVDETSDDETAIYNYLKAKYSL
jgi:hypothetical protein